MTTKLKKGHIYNKKALRFIGWSKKKGSYNNYWDYFRSNGEYYGPDNHGIEPLFDNGHDAEILICTDCGVGLTGRYKSYTTTKAKAGYGWCKGCYALRSAPTARLRHAQQQRRLKAMMYGHTLKAR
jgi:hypothetical protein